MLVVAVVCGMAVASQAGQTTTSTQTTKSFEVLSVDGSQLVVRLPEGTRELTVPDDFRFTVDGRQLAVGEMKPGMKGTATITTRTTVTPVTVTEVKNGTVMQATGGSVLVKTDQGFRNFTQGDLDKRGVKILKDGKAVQISDLHRDDRLTATIITSKPPRVMTEKEVNATLAAAPAPGMAPAAGASSASPRPAPTATTGSDPAAAAAAPAPARKLPKTASSWPLLGLASVVMLVLAFAFTLRRRFAV
jgi:LPXTG-motif cell wall-anchored protein